MYVLNYGGSLIFPLSMIPIRVLSSHYHCLQEVIGQATKWSRVNFSNNLDGNCSLKHQWHSYHATEFFTCSVSLNDIEEAQTSVKREPSGVVLGPPRSLLLPRAEVVVKATML